MSLLCYGGFISPIQKWPSSIVDILCLPLLSGQHGATKLNIHRFTIVLSGNATVWIVLYPGQTLLPRKLQWVICGKYPSPRCCFVTQHEWGGSGARQQGTVLSPVLRVHMFSVCSFWVTDPFQNQTGLGSRYLKLLYKWDAELNVQTHASPPCSSLSPQGWNYLWRNNVKGNKLKPATFY